MTPDWPWQIPVICAPMAGGPSTPALAAAVSGAGGLGFLAGGYLAPSAFAAQLELVEQVTDAAYGVNLFVPTQPAVDTAGIAAHREKISAEAVRYGFPLGEPTWNDDHYTEKVDILCGHRPAVVSFTFGSPRSEIIDTLKSATGALIVGTVTSVEEAVIASRNGVDAIAVQGSDAGGHRGLFIDDPTHPAGGELTNLATLLNSIRSALDIPMIAAGGIMNGRDVAVAMGAGAVAAALGTAFLCSPEAGTSEPYRRAILDQTYPDTIITRAFSGRPARGLCNGFAQKYTSGAPSGYPEIHYLTKPFRAAATHAGMADLTNLWAGTGWRRVTEAPAERIVRRLAQELSASR